MDNKELGADPALVNGAAKSVSTLTGFDQGEVEALLETRLRCSVGKPDGANAKTYGNDYARRHSEEINSFLWSIKPDYAVADRNAYPLRHIAQACEWIAEGDPPLGSRHHALLLSAETLRFYADLFAAIATEAQRAETVKQGSVYEGAMPQAIAQPQSLSPKKESDNG